MPRPEPIPGRDATDDVPDEVRAGLERTREYWERRARTPGSDLEKLEWCQERTVQLRYDAFLADHDLHGASVLDVGCGLAGFYAHLQREGIAAEYTGFDLSPEMARLCRRRYPDVPFIAGDFLRYEPEVPFDYTVAFGIHNIRMPAGEAILERTTRHQFALAGIAAHISLLTDRASGFAPHIRTWRAEEVLAMALRVTPYVALRHDYLAHDFSVTLYRAARDARRRDTAPPAAR